MKLSSASFLSRWMTVGALLLGVFGCLAPAARAAYTKPDDKWRIICLHNALSDGVIIFRLTPVGGESRELKVPIKDRTLENDSARDIRDVFRAQLPKEQYHIETDDGEAVLVKAKRGAPDFLLEFVSNSVNGIAVRVELD